MTHVLPVALRAVARRQPHSPALAWRGAQWTYEDLQLAIDGSAHVLRAGGVQEGSRIALLMRNSPHYVASYYGALLAACSVVPLNPQERAGVLARQIEHCEAALVIGDAEHPEWPALASLLKARGIAHRAADLGSHSAGIVAFREPLRTAPPTPLLEAQRLASIIYTSGTTGTPKGVMLSHGNLAANVHAIIEYLELTAEDRGLCLLPFQFAYGNSVMHTHLLAGAHLEIEDNFAFPHLTLKRLQDGAFTGFAGVPSTFALLLGRCRLNDFDLTRLRYVTQAGGPMPRPLVDKLREQAPGVALFTMYGQTEATARLTYLAPRMLDAKAGSIGKPVSGVEIEIRKDGARAAPNVVGELHARGPNIMLGYWNAPEATAKVLREGWLNTGDLAHVDEDGYLYIDGRAVDMIKVGAFRIAPQEIEEAIAALEGVEEVGVTGVPDEVLGQSIKAVIVPKPGTELTAVAIKAHCRQQLAAYKVPKYIEFSASLPRTPSGKVQRFKLAQGAESAVAADLLRTPS